MPNTEANFLIPISVDQKLKNMHQFKTRKEIADEYNIDVQTLNDRIKQAGLDIPPRRRISPKDVERIYAALGRPMRTD